MVQRCEMPGTPRSTFLMVFSPDGTKVASTHGNHNIYVTDLKSGKNIRTLVGHPRTPWCIAFHPTCNELVASGCLGGQVRIWDLSVSGNLKLLLTNRSCLSFVKVIRTKKEKIQIKIFEGVGCNQLYNYVGFALFRTLSLI